MINRRDILLGAAAASCGSAPEAASADTIFELRNYALHPGGRETLIALFEQEFIESQEALGAHVLATFRDLDAPDHFVWLRGFADMSARLAALTAFYTGPVWRAHREAANATMLNSDNVYLLCEAGAALHLPAERPPLGAGASSRAMFVVDIYAAVDGAAEMLSARARRDARVIAAFASARAPNNFPTLPVHAEPVFVALRRFEETRTPAPIAGMTTPLATLRLTPTARSLLR